MPIKYSLDNQKQIRRRALFLKTIRDFFDARGVIETETPVLSHSTTPDPALISFETKFFQPGNFSDFKLFYLQTSPEFFLKQLVAESGLDLFQIAHVFRNSEHGSWHKSEFLLLEWYRVGFNYFQLMDEVAELFFVLFDLNLVDFEKKLDTRPKIQKISYRSAFLKYAGFDPMTISLELLQKKITAHEPNRQLSGWTRDELLDYFLVESVAPKLGREGYLTFLYDYPPSQAALARVRTSTEISPENNDFPVAERFELYWQGIELANGFGELNQPVEQRVRFEKNLADRRALGLPEVPLDEKFLISLKNLPDCSGVAVGLDRLWALFTGQLDLLWESQ